MKNKDKLLVLTMFFMLNIHNTIVRSFHPHSGQDAKTGRTKMFSAVHITLIY